MTHFLQTDHWAAFQKHRGREVVQGTGVGWSALAYIENGKLGKRLYAPYGPEAENLTALKEALAWLQQEAKRLGALFVRVEPQITATKEQLSALGLQRVQRVQPEHTQIIDLTQSSEEILAQIKNTQRARWRNHEKKGMRIETSADPATIEDLISMLDIVTARNGVKLRDADYFRQQAAALMPRGAAKTYRVYLEDKVIACAFVYDGAGGRYYAHAGSDAEYRKLAPGTANVVQMILDAKDEGLQRFDLCGVVPPDQTEHSWYGFSEFKRSFGGKQHDYNGTWDFPVSKPRYALYQLAMKVAAKAKLV